MSPELKQAIRLIKSGQKQEGKEILLQILHEDENNDVAWVWLTATVDTDEMRLECLAEALKINPDNETAQRGQQKILHRIQKKEDDRLEELWNEEEAAFAHPEQSKPATPNTWSYYDHQQKPEPKPVEQNTGILHTTHNPFKTSPWLTIWYAPRTTVTVILESKNPQKHVLLIVCIVGIISGLSSVLPFMELGSTYLFMSIIGALVVGPIVAIIGLYISAAIFNWLGFFLGGNGSSSDVRVAMAWAYVPSTTFVVLTNLQFYVNSAMASFSDPLAQTSQISSVTGPLACLQFPIFIWIFYIQLQCLGAAHRFSARRALLTLAMPTIILIIFLCSLLYLILITTPYS